MMKLGRREFIASAAFGAAAAGRSGSAPAAPSQDDASDPLGVREDFPVTLKGTYLNTAYIGPPPLPVERAGIRFLRSKTEWPVSLGSMLEKTNEVRGKFARLFGADPDEVSFLFATSEGENIVAGALDLQPGDNVVIDELHYETTFLLYKELEKSKGIELRIVPAEEGRADPGHFEPYLDRRTRLLSVSWVSHQNGFRHDLKGLSELAHAHDAYLYVDAIQALGMFPTNLHEEGVDFLTSGTYKWLFASYGVAPFYLRREHLERLGVDRFGSLSIKQSLPNHEYETYETARKFEYATLAFGPVYQLGAGLDYLRKVGLERIESHTVGLAHHLRAALVGEGFRLLTPADNGSSIVSFVHGKAPDAVSELLREEDIQVSLREEGTQLRVSMAMFNNTADVDRFVEIITTKLT